MGLSLKEILDKTVKGRKAVEANMDQSKPYFHPQEASIYQGLKEADKLGIYETLSKVPLRTLCEKLGLVKGRRLTEFLGHSGALTTGTTGAAGAHYLIPDKIYATLFENARNVDITPLVSNIVDTPGATLKVDCEIDGKYAPKFSGSGGEAAYETIDTAQGTITPRLFSINIGITNEMIEDSLFDMMEMHIRVAGKAMGEFSTKMCLFPVMDDHRATATTYRIEGAYNVVASGGGYCYISDVMEAEGQNAIDGFTTDTLILFPDGPSTLLKGEGAGQPYDTEKVMAWDLKQNPIGTIAGMDVVRCFHMTTADVPVALQYYSGLYSTEWHNLAVNKTYGIQTVRKRWLKIENYSDPIEDLVGAVVSARQGHMVAYADAVCVISLT